MCWLAVSHVQKTARGKGSKLTCGELARCVLFLCVCVCVCVCVLCVLPVRLCRTQRKTRPPSPTTPPQPGGSRSERGREGESWVERRRSQISQWLHGVMYLWSAAMDCNPRSLLFILPLLLSCVVPAFTIIYPPNEGKGTLFLSVCLRTCVFMSVCVRARVRVCVCACVWAVRHGTRRAQCPCARRWTCSCSPPPPQKKKKLRRRQFKRRVKVTPGRC